MSASTRANSAANELPGQMPGQQRPPQTLESPAVAFYSDWGGGVYVYTHRLAAELRRLGFPVEIVTHPPDSEDSERKVELLRTHADRLCFVARAPSPHRQVTALAEVFEGLQARVLIPNYRRAAYAACAAVARCRPLRVVGLSHGAHESYYSLLADYQSLIGAFVCPSPVALARLAKTLPHRRADLHCIPYGVPLGNALRENFSGGVLKLVYHGRIVEEQKRLSYLIALADSLRRRGVPFRLSLIGDGPDLPRYRIQARKLGLETQIEWIGEQPWSELQRRLRESHLTVLTSEWEGFCLSLAEAMGCGLPAVAFACGGVIEEYLQNGENGFVVPFGNVELLADRVEQLHQDPRLWLQFSAAAHREIQSRFSLARFGTASAELFREIAQSPARRWPRLRPPLVRHDRSPAGLLEKFGKWLAQWK